MINSVFQEEFRTLSLVSRDYHPMNVFNIEYMVDNTSLGFLATDAEANFIIFMYQPESRDSQGGQKLLRKSDYHVGQRINALFRIQCNSTNRHWQSAYENKHTTFYGMRYRLNHCLSDILIAYFFIFPKKPHSMEALDIAYRCQKKPIDDYSCCRMSFYFIWNICAV